FFAVMGIHDFLCLPKWTSAEVQEKPHLDVRSTLQRLLFYCTPPAVADVVIPDPISKDLAVGTPSSKIFFYGDDDDDDVCVEILLVTPLHSNAAIPSSGNQCGSSATPTAKGSNPQDSQGKGVMVDDAGAPSASVNRLRPSSRHVPSFRNVFGDAIHTDFFPFSACPYYATYPEDGVARNCEFTQEE
ncbi:hypothetical protein Tco_1306391, partial [Tanacetum coccineum]